MELGKLIFYFCGYVGEKLDFLDENGKRVLMIIYHYLGGSVTLPVTPDEYANSPEEGMLVRVAGLCKLDKKRGTISLVPFEFSYEGRDPKFVMPTEAELIAGARFKGLVIISSKNTGIMQDGSLYRNAIIGFFGGAYKFSSLDEKIYELLPEQGILAIGGKVDTRIIGYKIEGISYKRCENTLLLQEFGKPQAEQKQPKQAAA